VALTKSEQKAKISCVSYLKFLKQNTNSEEAHYLADECLIQFIERLTGDYEITSAFGAIKKKYK
jgi:hypothetical protein